MSFIDLMSNTVFTDTQITRRTESLVRQKFNQEQEQILNRKAVGAALGSYTLTVEEQQELSSFQSTVENARALGEQARADNNLLQRTINYEKSTKRLEEYIKSEGRPERLEGYYPALPENATHAELSDGSVEPLPYYGDLSITEYVVWLPYQEEIPPEPLETEQVQEDGTVLMVPNPIVVKDEEERTQAQSTVDNTAQDAIDLANQRKGNG